MIPSAEPPPREGEDSHEHGDDDGVVHVEFGDGVGLGEEEDDADEGDPEDGEPVQRCTPAA